ncbi:GAP family protein [Pseudonocardia broussonetiae]|uniref:GAP family protein n=1 Tax=Pseudonocardia broussonetiae TaxID=2736640 RepID=A0A6M6JS03_9PSEU|nr:GAP family protein [Pseudonocardia broussonetiae]QJY49199.1 hypothetical protein HOP40_28435 [Pseudonocardia broussonetiae]
MSIEVVLLALTAVVRPTSAAVVVAILSTGRPRRLLTAYVLSGLAFSLAVGALVLLIVQHVGPARAATARPVVDVVLGLLLLGCAGADRIGYVPSHDPGPAGSPRWLQRRLDRLSPSGAATLGVFLHLPGVVYLAALNAIAGYAPGTVSDVVQLSIYNAFRLGVPLVALVLSTYRLTATRDSLARATSWSMRHRRGLVVAFCGTLGAYLLLTGAVDLARGR